MKNTSKIKKYLTAAAILLMAVGFGFGLTRALAKIGPVPIFQEARQ